jgi:CDP-glucose 4,6-dehydratase
MNKDLYNQIFKGRKVLITGHTGFKGSWLCLILHQMEADVHGYALEPPTSPSLFKEAKIEELVTSNIADIRDYENLLKVIEKTQPEIIIHMAAQPLVLESYKNPRETFEINVMGTVNLLEAVRHVNSVKAIVNVTSDKCYENKEWHWGYRESEAMGGYDPYSNSKGCSELVTSAFRNSYFNSKTFESNSVALASARAGNVIGGGDWAQNRLIPDFIRAISMGEKVIIRNPCAERPWQHVLEPLSGYLTLAAKLYTDGVKYAGGWNFGPNDFETKNVEWIINNICNFWGDGASYLIENNPQNHEAHHLKLDSSKAKSELGWFPKWNTESTLKSIVEWHKAFLKGENIRKITEEQIHSYFNS